MLTRRRPRPGSGHDLRAPSGQVPYRCWSPLSLRPGLTPFRKRTSFREGLVLGLDPLMDLPAQNGRTGREGETQLDRFPPDVDYGHFDIVVNNDRLANLSCQV